MSYPFILYDNVFASGVTATDTEGATGDYSVDYIYDLRPFTFWQADTFGTKYITMDAGSAVAVDTLAIYKHNLNTATATVSLESSTTGAWGGEEVEQIAGFIPSDDKAIVKIFTQATVRYWRIKIVTASVAPNMAVAMIGESLDFPVYPDSPFTRTNEQMNATAEIAKEGGHPLGVTQYYSPVSFPVSLTYPQTSWVDGDFKTFWDSHGKKGKPFFWVPNITEWATDIFFVWFPPGFSLNPSQSDTTNYDSLALEFTGTSED
jgi:hypothetical protein